MSTRQSVLRSSYTPSLMRAKHRQFASNTQRPKSLCNMLNTMQRVTETDHVSMSEALEEAREAAERGDIPIGAVLVINDEIVARARNRTITHCDPTAHAEILGLACRG